MYYYLENNQQKGPVPAEALRANGVTGETLVWTAGMLQWAKAKDVPDLSKYFTEPDIPLDLVNGSVEETLSQGKWVADTDGGMILGTADEMKLAGGDGKGQAGEGYRPGSHWVLTVLSLLCFFPLGIVALVYALRVGREYAQGRWQLAERASLLARRWAVAAIVVGVLASVTVVGYWVYQEVKKEQREEMERAERRRVIDEAYGKLTDYAQHHNKECPVELDEGLLLTEVKLNASSLVLRIVCDERQFDIDAMNNSDFDAWRLRILASLCEDQGGREIMEWCKDADVSFGYLYKGNYSGDECLIKIPVREIRRYLRQH